jgi:membrane-associated phospholipid phosphatase
VNGRVEVAFTNADGLIRLEQSLGIFWEIQFQGLILGHQFLIDFFNGVYIWGHIPVVGGLALWLYFFRRDCFARYRNAFLISGAVGLVFFLTLPMAPPRFIAEAGFVDTVSLYNNAYRVLQPPTFVNQYAAMPSLHFGWNLLVGLAVFQTTRAWYAKTFALLMPLLVMAGIILPGNHYILDGVIGGTVALAALWFAGFLNRRFQGTRIHAVLV